MNNQSARAAAMKTLLDCGINRLPVDIDAICEKLGICVLSYDAGAEVIERAHLYRAVRDANGLTFYWGSEPVAMFNERQELPRILFTLGHELGHIVLGHVTPGHVRPQGVARARPDVDWNIAREETAANRFASLLLAPPNVLWSMGVRRTNEIMELCKLPRKAAAYSARCIAGLSRRKVSPLSLMEQAVCQRFQSYIRGGTAI